MIYYLIFMTLLGLIANKSHSLLLKNPSNSPTILSLSKTDKQNKKLGVLLLNLGGPETLEDVEGFLYNLFADPEIIRLPTFLSFLQKPIATYISKTRAPKSAEGYKSIGGGSPIVKYTKAQSDLLQKSLQEKGYKQTKCYFAMRYWKPYTDEVLQEIRRDGIEELVILPLYPQYSISTTGSSLKAIREVFEQAAYYWKNQQKVLHTVIPSWYNRPGYLNVMAKLIKEKYDQFTPEQRAKEPIHILFSAHGVPESYIQAGDPYKQHIEECVELISNNFKDKYLSSDSKQRVHIHLSFQSRVGPVPWLRPYTEEMLTYLGQTRQVKNLIVIPISFVSEHIETLEEIDMEYQEIAHSMGITNWKRVPTVNMDPHFIEDLSKMVEDSLNQRIFTVDEVLDKNFFPQFTPKKPELENKYSQLTESTTTTGLLSSETKKNTCEKMTQDTQQCVQHWSQQLTQSFDMIS